MALPEALASHRPAVFERFGMGWIFRPPNAPIVMIFDRIRERSDEPYAEIHITTHDGGHLIREKLPLMGSRKVVEIAKDLDALLPGLKYDWKAAVIEGCESTLEAYRQGTPILTLDGAVQKADPVRWQCDRFMMADVVNCWLASAATGKSTFAKAYALHHALGLDFLGRPMTRGIPLYIDYEDSYENFRRAMYEIAAGLRIQTLPKLHWKRGGGPLRNQVHQLATMIDTLGITLIIIDSVAAAGGPMGDRGYESVAMDIEQALIALPPVTVLLIDHVTGDDMKSNAIPLKARGAQRKYEFVRYQWTLVLDRDQAHSGKHMVGWTHTKTNITRLQEPFAVEIYHDDDQVSFGLVKPIEVAPMAANMSVFTRILAEVERSVSETGEGVSLDELCTIIYGEVSKAKRESIRTTLRRDPKRQLLLTDAGLVLPQRTPTPLRLPYQNDDNDLPF